jgi:tripartite-type tricarboxylate transporter receptor subunit TctC
MNSSFSPSRRRLLQGAALGVAGAGIGLASAQGAWPQKPIRLVVPYAPGGSADTLGRALAKHLGEVLGQSVVVDNKSGAGGLIGSQQVSKSAPDGYTLVVSGIGSHVIASADKVAFDPLKDFTHIALFGGPPIAFVVNAAQPYRDVAGFISHVSADSKGVSYGSPGQGTHGHLTAELFRAAHKLNMVHISYKGAGPAVTDLLANQIPAAFMTLSSANAHIVSGKLRLLALTAPHRLAEFPNVPTFAELGQPNLTGTTWFGLSGPPGLPPAIVERINAEVRRGLQTPAVKAMLAAESMVTTDMDAATFTRFVGSELERWGPPARAVLGKS